MIIGVLSFFRNKLVADSTPLPAKEAKQFKRETWKRRKGGQQGTEVWLNKGQSKEERGRQGKNGQTKMVHLVEFRKR